MKKKTIFALFFLVSLMKLQAQKLDSLINKYTDIHYQVTVVQDWHSKFLANYLGENSLSNEPESAMSITSTMFLNIKPWKNAKIVFNPELAGGKGFSGATGIAGFPNGEIFRVGDPTPKIYMARMALEQNFNFKNNQSLKLVAGKFCLADYFDNNDISHDPRTQFLNWALMSFGAWDYPANVRGYTAGLVADFQKNDWNFRASYSLEPTKANGPDLSLKLNQNFGLTTEIEKKIRKNDQVSTDIKLLTFLNQSPMGNYYLASQMLNPDITATRKYGRKKYGLGINVTQNFNKNFGGFFRGSWNDGKNETWAYTEIDNSLSLGFKFFGNLWKRPNDHIGVAFVTNGISKDHQIYLANGGIGFIIGDGHLLYGRESIPEIYYSLNVFKYYTLSLDYQYAIHPAYDKARGNVNILGLRFHIYI